MSLLEPEPSEGIHQALHELISTNIASDGHSDLLVQDAHNILFAAEFFNQKKHSDALLDSDWTVSLSGVSSQSVTKAIDEYGSVKTAHPDFFKKTEFLKDYELPQNIELGESLEDIMNETYEHLIDYNVIQARGGIILRDQPVFSQSEFNGYLARNVPSYGTSKLGDKLDLEY